MPSSIDNVIICPPTYGMYSVNAAINDVAVQQVPLTDTFQLNVEGILKFIKIIEIFTNVRKRISYN